MLVKLSPVKAVSTRLLSQRTLIWSLLLILLLGGSGCMLGTAARLWQTRRQMLAYEKNIQFLPSTEQRGPGIRFLNPKLKPADILTVASQRFPSVVDTVDGYQHWTFVWHRRPMKRGKSIHLDLYFLDDRLERLHVDHRFSDYLGAERIEMLVRNFVSGKTDLDLSERRISCRIPRAELEPFEALMLHDLRELFGKENKRVSSTTIPKDEIKLIFRYRLVGAKGAKSGMSFGATIRMDDERLGRITSRIGSFQLEFDLSEQPE